MKTTQLATLAAKYTAARYFATQSSIKNMSNIRFGLPAINSTRVRNHGSSGYNGLCECERRKRQIANGQLKKENGLVV